MHHAATTYIEIISQFLKTAFQVFTTLHQVLDIVYAWEVGSQKIEKVALLCWQSTACQDLEQVSEIVSTIGRRTHRRYSISTVVSNTHRHVNWFGHRDGPVEGNPFDLIQKYESRADQQLSKVVDVDSVILVLLKVDARLCQEIDRVLSIHIITRDVSKTIGQGRYS